jgi:hypothetical protein
MTETMEVEIAAPNGAVFSVDRETRTIRGRAVPFGVEGVKAGRKWSFSKDTVRPYGDTLSSVKLWGLHDKTQAVGVLTEAEHTDDGYDVAFKVARTAAGDHALTMAEDGVWDGLSLGPHETAKFALRDGVYHAVDVPIQEISLTPAPVFGGARVSSVVFDVEKGSTMTTTETEETPPPAAVTFDVAPIADAITAGFAALGVDPANPQSIAERISPTQGFEVNEPSPYRFDGVQGEQSFAVDLRAAQAGDSEAAQRLETFAADLTQFAVTTTNVAALNPVQNRPDLYVPHLQYNTPLWDMVMNGVIDSITQFTIPKFSSASGLVGAHTQGTEPTPGAFAATVQTVTPGALSGKIEINREVWDQAGSPQADGIIWGEMVGGYYEAREAKIAAVLAAVATSEINLAGATDAALQAALLSYFAGLQFVRGGNRFTAFAADGKLFPALVGAKDGQGRLLFPVLGAMNAAGETDGAFSTVMVGNQPVKAAWALGSTNASQSFSFVPSSVWAWASPPKKFTFEYQVKSIDMAVWGYSAAAVTRDSDVQPIDYTTADS